MYKQWTTPDDKRFFPAGAVRKQLPPGYYSIEMSPHGLYFEQKPLKNQSLIRFPDAATDAVIEEIEKFWQMEESFRSSDIPYKRGMLLYGPPGSGKTCTLRIVVENLIKEHQGIVVDMPNTYTLKEGYEVLRTIHEDMPLIILMEDLEALLSRNSESEMLNLLDGMYGIDKTIFLGTTNYPERLGSRIMNRPSRFDKKIFIGMPSMEAREIFIRGKLIDEEEDIIEQWVKDTDGMSIAHIHELFVANRILGDSYEQAVKVLKKMVNTPDSTSFDPYRVVSIDEENYSEKKQKIYESWGTGERYKEALKRGGQVLTESVQGCGRGTARPQKKRPTQGSPADIAQMMSEDISVNNGLIID